MRRTTEGLRRYSRVTAKQIAKGTGVPKEEVKKVLQELLKDKFIRRCYDDEGRLIEDLYELPVSLDETGEEKTMDKLKTEKQVYVVTEATAKRLKLVSLLSGLGFLVGLVCITIGIAKGSEGAAIGGWGVILGGVSLIVYIGNKVRIWWYHK